MKLPNVASRTLGSSKLSLQKNAPTILTVAGVAGFAITTALAIRATAKAVDVLPEIAKDIHQAKETVLAEVEAGEADAKDVGVAVTKVYAKSSLVLAEVYWPVLLTGSASAVCILVGHGMMKKRQASLVAAYTMLDAGYKAYRARVQEHLGEEKELALYRGVRTVEAFEDDGTTPCEIIDMDDVMPSPYARFFDESSPNWRKTPEYNLLFLRSQQDWANDRLRAQGYLFLNEVYEALGLERSQAGQMVGWRYDAKKNHTGDGFVDFGLYNIGDECNRAFVNIIEHTVLLDFNVDGIISI